jgi:hypothetical protein
MAGILLGSSVMPFTAKADESAAPTAADAPKVCNNILGCPIEGELKPPPRVFKNILEEEQELAKQQAEIARKARQEKLDEEVKIVRGQFAVIKKGRNDMEKELLDAISAAGANQIGRESCRERV